MATYAEQCDKLSNSDNPYEVAIGSILIQAKQLGDGAATTDDLRDLMITLVSILHVLAAEERRK